MAGVGFLFARTVGTTLLARSWRFQLVGTLAVTVVLESGVILAFGALPHSVPVSLATRTVSVAGITLSWHRILVLLAVAAAFLGLRVLLTRARIGKAMRALAQNREAAVDLGIDVRRVATVTFVLSGALAGVGGVLFAPLYTVTPTMGAPVTFKALAAVVMAGAESTGAVFLAALLLGVAEALAGGFGLAPYQEAMGFVVMVLVLLARPHGLAGRTARA
jgi:branched-chain amino acid transport system permease protein